MSAFEVFFLASVSGQHNNVAQLECFLWLELCLVFFGGLICPPLTPKTVADVLVIRMTFAATRTCCQSQYNRSGLSTAFPDKPLIFVGSIRSQVARYVSNVLVPLNTLNSLGFSAMISQL